MKVAIIFAGGFGQRLQPLTKKIHKSLIMIQDKPLIEHIITNLLQLTQLTKIIVITGYRQQDFSYLRAKYRIVTLINNDQLQYQSAYALALVKAEFTGINDIFIISGDFVMKTNCFSDQITTNCMAAMQHNNQKSDWRYQLDQHGNIIDLVKTSNPNQLLASEWSHISHQWAAAIGNDLQQPEVEQSLKTMMIGKYLINSSQIHHQMLKPYLINYDDFWDLDGPDDLERINHNF